MCMAITSFQGLGCLVVRQGKSGRYINRGVLEVGLAARRGLNADFKKIEFNIRSHL